MKVRTQLFFALFTLLTMTVAPVMNAQARLNDKDVQALLKNLRNDAKAFRSPFSAALHKSAIRGTGQEKDAKRMADDYARLTDSLYKHFRNKKRASDQVQAMLDATARLNRIVYSHNLSPAAIAAWERVRADVHLVAQAWGIQEPYYQNSSLSTSANTFAGS
jgi:hypothetical protein